MKLVKNKIDPKTLTLEETLFHVANGYLGVRGNFEEGYAKGLDTIRGCYINGYYDTVPLSYPERLYGFPEHAQRIVNLPDFQAMRLFLDGEEVSLFDGEVLHFERTIDTDEGIYTRSFTVKTPLGKTVTVKIKRLASFARQELFYTSYKVSSVDFGGKIEVVSEINCDVWNFAAKNDPRVASEHIKHIIKKDTKAQGGYACVEVETAMSKLLLALCSKCVAAGAKVLDEVVETGTKTTVSANISPGESLLVKKYVTASDSRRQKNPPEHAKKVLDECVMADDLFGEQKEFLAKFWKSAKIEIGGCKDLQDGLEFNIYSLLQSTSRDSIAAVAAKGISGEGYEGHYFWDTEIYIFPFFLYTQPEIAKSLLSFRHITLDGAREHAKIMGHTKGALFPWRTISGSECSSYFPSGSAQYHLTGDVAHSFMQYYHATDDLEFFVNKGLEVLLETARLWLDAGSYAADGYFHIHEVTGPDEYTCCVSDNYYTNRTAEHNLRGAIEVHDRLKELGRLPFEVDIAELELFAKAADSMFYPYDEKLGIHGQDSSFLQKPIWDIESTPKDKFPLLLHYHPLYLYRYQVCKQADAVLADFLFEDDVPPDVMRRGYEYYERVTTHDSSLSSCVFGIMASKLGFKEKAYRYFGEAVFTDLNNTHGNTKDGLHTANLGGTWLAVVCGFAGLRVKRDGLHFKFNLPSKWDSCSFRIRYKKSLLHVKFDKSEWSIELLEGSGVDVLVDGIKCCVR